MKDLELPVYGDLISALRGVGCGFLKGAKNIDSDMGYGYRNLGKVGLTNLRRWIIMRAEERFDQWRKIKVLI
jgi:hypothetical protein